MAEPTGEFRRVRIGHCEACPRGRSFGERLTNIGRTVVPRCMGAGPADIMVAGAVRLDPVTGIPRIEKSVEAVCPADLARNYEWARTWFNAALYDTFENAHAEASGGRPVQVLGGPLLLTLGEEKPSGVLRSQKAARRELYEATRYFVKHPEELPARDFSPEN